MKRCLFPNDKKKCVEFYFCVKYVKEEKEIMELREYLFRHRLKVTDFAKKINYGRTYINEIVVGTKKAGRKLAYEIEKATNGEVKADELLRVIPKKSHLTKVKELTKTKPKKGLAPRK